MANELLKVKLIAHTPEPERVIASSAKLCYSPVGVEQLMERQTEEQVSQFLKRLMSMGHESPIEHVSFSFAVEGISRIVETQLVRHRLASYSIQSGRYVKRSNPDFVTPNLIKEVPQALEVYNETLQFTMKSYNELVNILMNHQIEKYMISKGLEPVEWEEFYTYEFETTGKRVNYNKFEKVAIENARYVYPQALATKVMVTMNARSLMNFMAHRICRRAQDEIQELAWAMLEELRGVAPMLSDYMGASCMFGKCKEGVMCCGNPIKTRPWELTNE